MNKLDLTEAPTSVNMPESQDTTKTNYDFNVTDGTLWRTTVPSSKTLSTETPTVTKIAESQDKSQIDFHMTDNTLWRTNVPSSRTSLAETPTSANIPESRDTTKTNYNFDVTDNSLWRTKVPSSRTSLAETSNASRASGNQDNSGINFHVTDNSLWRTNVPSSRSSLAEASNASKSSGNQDNSEINFEVTDNPLWRTTVEADATRAIRTQDITTTNFNFNVSDNSLWRTINPSSRSSLAGKSDKSKTDESQDSSGLDFHVTDNPLWRTNVPSSRNSLANESFYLRKSAEHEVLSQSPPKTFAEQEEQHESIESSHLQKSAEHEVLTQLSPKTFAEQEEEQRQSIESSHLQNSPEHEVLNQTPIRIFAEQRKQRQSIEAFTQTSFHDKNNRRRTVLHQMHEQSPGLPRKSIYNPRLFQRPLPPLAPFFTRLSTGSTQSGVSDHESNKQSSQKLIEEVEDKPIEVEYKPIEVEHKPVEFEITTTTPTRSHFFNSLFSNVEPKSGVIPVKHPVLDSNARPMALFDIGYDSTGNFEQIEDPLSQQIPSQRLPQKPVSLLNDDDFQFASPAISKVKRVPLIIDGDEDEKPTTSANLPNESRFHGANDTYIEGVTINSPEKQVDFDETAGVSFIEKNGDSDLDSDINSPAPKHIVLRVKPEKKEPYMFAKAPKIIQGTNDEFADEHPQLRRSKRTRLARPLRVGEQPIYERDENGDYNLVGVTQGKTADPLCRKFNTFDKDVALEMQKQEQRRKKRAREMNKAQRRALAEKYAENATDSP